MKALGGPEATGGRSRAGGWPVERYRARRSRIVSAGLAGLRAIGPRAEPLLGRVPLLLAILLTLPAGAQLVPESLPPAPPPRPGGDWLRWIEAEGSSPSSEWFLSILEPVAAEIALEPAESGGLFSAWVALPSIGWHRGCVFGRNLAGDGPCSEPLWIHAGIEIDPICGDREPLLQGYVDRSMPDGSKQRHVGMTCLEPLEEPEICPRERWIWRWLGDGRAALACDLEPPPGR